MYSLFKKEISSFFGSITGYVVIVIFLISNSLFIWIFQGGLNVLESGYASLETLFLIAPWVFLFLVPAITMRMFSEEMKSGTFELLLTKPLTEMQIVLAKFFAGIVLVIFSLLPTLIYFTSIYALGNPAGNIDIGATWGSYIGLFFLASIYVAVGVFSSSITDNQMIAFLVAVLISFFVYIGFDSISNISSVNAINNFIVNLGINEHYKSISRGVVDSRDIIYFTGVSFIFIFATKTIIQSRKW